MRALALLIVLSSPVAAQTVAGQDLTAISQAAQNAQTQAAAALAAVPPVCSTAPASDSLNGTVGTSAACTPRLDATRPTPVQTVNTTLNADCTWSVTFARSFTSSVPIVHAGVALPSNATQPIPCFPMARSSTAASGKCFPGQTTVLSLSIVTTGLTLNAFGSSCTAGLPIMVVGREPTQ